ncbi:MAG: MFS transporter [Thermoplasmataceae archaeon]
MVQYKWVALSNTTIGILMASINGTIILISIPAIFNGIHINFLQSNSLVYLLWLLMGYNIVTTTLLVSFGRLSDIYGRVKLFNLGFMIFTIGSILLSLTYGTGDQAALELIIFRLVQGVGAAFLFSNSSAIITDAFPVEERGMALGLNMVAALAGSFIGLVLGGILSVFDWRYVFLVSVPVGAIGTIWSYWKMKETGIKQKDEKIDYFGNATFGIGLTLILIGVTYGLLPYGTSMYGWLSPWVDFSLVTGTFLLVLFPFVELRVKHPMFRMELFKIRAFAAGNFASLLAALGRGGVMLMLIILLQGIWLPIHGYSFSSTPFWAGVFMLPMTAGFLVTGPISGRISDKHGPRFLTTFGMVIVALSFALLAILPYNFYYPDFALILFLMGFGSGVFAAPNAAAIMNSVPAETRGSASGMRATIQNAAQTASLGLFFTIVLTGLSINMPASIGGAIASLNLNNTLSSEVTGIISGTSPTILLFSAFLGKNPVVPLLQLAGVFNLLPLSAQNTISGTKWFPNALAYAFMSSLRIAFIVGIIMSLIAALVSGLSGKKYVHEGAKSIYVEKQEVKLTDAFESLKTKREVKNEHRK